MIWVKVLVLQYEGSVWAQWDQSLYPGRVFGEDGGARGGESGGVADVCRIDSRGRARHGFTHPCGYLGMGSPGTGPGLT